MSHDKPRVVIDTSVILSSILLPASVPGRAVKQAFASGQVLVSRDTLAELTSVLARPTFVALMNAAQASEYVAVLAAASEVVDVSTVITACRDPNDDKFLALAISGDAAWIITGDADLLVLNPFHGVEIASPRAFLDQFDSQPLIDDDPL